MPDIMTKEKRSLLMSKIRGKNTKPELVLRKTLIRYGLRGYRLHTNLPGKPDIVFSKKKLAIFCDGEFWHGHQFHEWKRTLTLFWLQKITANIKRDRKNDRLLESEGWTVLRFWGRAILKNPDLIIKKIKAELRKKDE